jgi:anti-anti-sigma factor
MGADEVEHPLPLGPALRGRIERVDGMVTLALSGEFDLAGAPEMDLLLRRIERERPLGIVVDLDRVRFIDSRALQTLVAATFRARESRHSFAVHEGAGVAARLIALAGLEGMLVHEPPGDGPGGNSDDTSALRSPSATTPPPAPPGPGPTSGDPPVPEANRPLGPTHRGRPETTRTTPTGGASSGAGRSPLGGP